MKKGKIYQILIFCFALGGFLDASYLVYKHYQGGLVICAVFNGCDTVLNSSYALVWGVPVALLGAGFYFTVLVFSLFILSGWEELKKPIFLLSMVGVLTSLYFLYLQIFVIKEFCFYCLISVFATVGIFIFSLFLLKRKKQGNIV